MATAIELHRRHITGEIKADTPICVILEMATCSAPALQIDWSKRDEPHYINSVVIALGNLPTASVVEWAPGTADAKSAVVGTIVAAALGEQSKIPVWKDGEHGFQSDKDLEGVANFINNDSSFQWHMKPLLKAYRHLMQFYKVQEPPLPPVNFVIGQKTNTTPQAYNACMLYRLCVYHKIKTTRAMPIEQLGALVRALNEDVSALRQRLIAVLPSLSKVDLINMSALPEFRVAPSPNIKVRLDSAPAPAGAGTTKHDDLILPTQSAPTSTEGTVMRWQLDGAKLIAAHTQMTSFEYVLPRIQPMIPEEAIVLAAIRFAINLCECGAALREYAAMAAASDGKYVPSFDKEYAQRYLINPGWFDVRKTWAPALYMIYQPADLQRFAEAEGYSENEIKHNDLLQLLHTARAFPTFYLGRHPDAPVQSIIDLDEAGNTHRRLLVSYGRALDGHLAKTATDHKTQPFTLYNIPELTAYFEANKSFGDPARPGELFSPTAIIKLRNIAREQIRYERPAGKSFQTKRPPAETEIEVCYRHLLEIIDVVTRLNASISEEARAVGHAYRTGDAKTREAIRTFLDSVLHLGMYMRGWKVSTTHYPLTSADTMFPPDQQATVDLNVTTAMRTYDAALAAIPTNLRARFTTLPLMFHKSTSQGSTFEANTDPNKGKTIHARVEICRTGTRTDNIHSCIRMSSNMLVWSAYFYMTMCGLSEPFNLRTLSKIS